MRRSRWKVAILAMVVGGVALSAPVSAQVVRDCGDAPQLPGWLQPFEGLLRYIGAIPRPATDCLDQTRRLPQEIADMWGDAAVRNYHQLWHFVSGGGLNRVGAAERTRMENAGWKNPGHTDEQLGLDFLCMHEEMIDYTEQAYAAIKKPGELSCQVNGWSIDAFPWGVDDTEIDRAWPVPQWPGETPSFKTRESGEQMRSQVMSTFANDEWLRTVSLAQVGRGMERSFHNWMHMRFAGPQPEGDACKTDWLGSTCSSQQNPYFWKLHPMIDELARKWVRANAGKTVPVFSGQTITIPAEYGDPAKVSERQVHEYLTILLKRDFGSWSCWMGPMPPPPVVNGTTLTPFLHGQNHTMTEAEMNEMAANRARNAEVVEDLGEVLRSWDWTSMKENLLPVGSALAGTIDPALKTALLAEVQRLNGERLLLNGGPVFDDDEVMLLEMMMEDPGRFAGERDPLTLTVLNRALTTIRNEPETWKIRRLIRANPAAMAVPEIAALVGTPEAWEEAPSTPAPAPAAAAPAGGNGGHDHGGHDHH